MSISEMEHFELFTIGYEGREIGEFVSRLKSNKVTRLIDVRDIPLSRKRGFSKTALQQKLTSENIEYLHLKQLGSPTDLRNKLKNDHDYDYFFQAYSEHLSKNPVAISDAYRYITDGVNCVMCFERQPDKCHRSIVVEMLKKHNGNDFKIIHI